MPVLTETECTFPLHAKQTKAAARHMALATGPGAPFGTYYIAQCAHLGARCVVETRNLLCDFVMVDYVQYEPEFLVEGHGLVVGSDGDARIKDMWEWLNGRMLAGEPPDPEQDS